ncbi:MAG TPA: RDD family protein, partial [Chthoniobacteraceae bacterium]
MNLESELRIRTPEGIVFSYTLAGPVTRCLALTVDFVVVLLLDYFLGSVPISLAVISPDWAMAFTYLMYFVIWVGYGILFEWVGRGQTVGKWLLRLRVTDAQGYRLRFHQIFLRN